MTDRDLTPAEARAEVEAFMGEAWQAFANIAIGGHCEVEAWRFTSPYRGKAVMRGEAKTYRAAVDALLQAWRDAVRPWVVDAGNDWDIYLSTE